MKKYKDCYIELKGGIIKSYYLNDEFVNDNEKLIDELSTLFDEIYSNDCCVYGASNRHKSNKDLKNKICKIIKPFYDLKITIVNGWDDKVYKNFEDIENYILNY